MSDESRDAISNAATSGDQSPAVGAAHSGTGDINIDQSVNYGPAAQLTYRGERLLSKTLEELLGYFETHTSLQAERLVEPFIGKPLHVEGRVANIRRVGDAFVSVHLRNEVSDMILASFAPSWEDRLAEPNLNDELALVGRITEIAMARLSLEDCQLID